MKEISEMTPEEKKDLEETAAAVGMTLEEFAQLEELTKNMSDSFKEAKEKMEIACAKGRKRNQKRQQKIVKEMMEGFAKDAENNYKPKEEQPDLLDLMLDGDYKPDWGHNKPDPKETIHNLYLEMREMLKNAKDPNSLNKAEFFEKWQKLREMEKEENSNEVIKTSLSTILLFLEDNNLSSLEQDRPKNGYTYFGFLQDADLSYLRTFEPELFVEVRRFIETLTGKKMDNPYKKEAEKPKEKDPLLHDYWVNLSKLYED